MSPSHVKYLANFRKQHALESIDHHANEGPSAVWLLFECYSPTMYGRLPIAFRQRSIVADLEEYPPCPGSFASRSRWYRLALRQG